MTITYDEAIKGLATSVLAELATVSVKRFGAKGDDSTDDTIALQKAIDYVAGKGGGTVVFPRGVYRVTQPLIAKQGVILQAQACNYQYIGGGVAHTVLKGTGAMRALILATGDVQGFGVEGLALSGDGTVESGIEIGGAYWCSFRQFNAFGFKGRAIWLKGGFNSRVHHALVTNCGYGLTSATAYVGVLDVGGTDHSLHDLEISYADGSTAPASYSSGMYVATIRLAGANHMLSGSIVAEFGEVGIAITGDHCKLTTTRADNNWGHGVVITGSNNSVAASATYENGKRGNGTYSGWRVSGFRNTLASVIDYCNDPARMKYGFEDAVQTAVADDRNRYNAWSSNCNAPFKGDSVVGSSPAQDGHVVTITSPGAGGVIDVRAARFVKLDFAATTITKITGGYAGKEITLFTGGSGMKLADNNQADGFYFGSGDVTLTPARGFRLTYVDGKWLA